MAFTIDDIIIDRIQYGVAEKDGNLLYTLTQLSDATIDITAESKDAVDHVGTLIKRFYQSKAGEFTATNAMINLNVLGSASGEDKQIAKVGKEIIMPKIITVGKGVSTINLVGLADKNTVKVAAIAGNGAQVKTYSNATAVNNNSFSVAESTGVLTLPTDNDTDFAKFIVKYQRKVEAGVKIANKADKFPGTIQLTLKALCVDPCDVDTLKACYIYFPSFQVSPETSVSLTTDSNLDYKGTLQVNYCDSDKTLYEIYMAEDDDEDEDNK